MKKNSRWHRWHLCPGSMAAAVMGSTSTGTSTRPKRGFTHTVSPSQLHFPATTHENILSHTIGRIPKHPFASHFWASPLLCDIFSWSLQAADFPQIAQVPISQASPTLADVVRKLLNLAAVTILGGGHSGHNCWKKVSSRRASCLFHIK